MKENDISYLVRGAAFRVYNNLGPGLLENIYLKALMYELSNLGLETRKEVSIPVLYNGIELGNSFRADIIINNKVILEIKSVDALNKLHHKQLSSYLRLTGFKLGLLINFNSVDMKNGIKRIVNRL